MKKNQIRILAVHAALVVFFSCLYSYRAVNTAYAAQQSGQTGIQNTTSAETEKDAADGGKSADGETGLRTKAPQISGLKYDHSMELDYADQFRVDYYEGGYKYFSIAGTGEFLLVPEGARAPENLPEDAQVVYQPADSIYLAATSAMDFFDALDAVGDVKLSCLEEGDWFIASANEAMKDGSMVYAGKYSAPDYERIVAEHCSLAVESTMILHQPKVREMLLKFGIPVIVEHSSYETEPLGRSEWIKFYGALLNREDEADRLFTRMKEKAEGVLASEIQTSAAGTQDEEEGGEPLTAFFSISQNGAVTVRKSADYIPKMIAMAGGKYVFDDLGGKDALSTMNIQMEEFYAAAKDCDVLIYNSTIQGAVNSIGELEDKSSLMADFKAVKEGNVWCTSQSLFQKPTALADLLVDFHKVLKGDTDSGLTYLYRVGK